MKRRMLKLFACTAIMAMALSVTACGGSGKEDKAAETETAAGDDAEAADDKDTAGADDVDDDNDNEIETDTVDGADNADAAGTEDTDGADNADAADSNAAAGTTLEELVQDPAAKASFDTMTQALASEAGMSASVNVVGNEMIVEVKFEDSSLMKDGLSETIEAAIDAQTETFNSQVKALDAVIGQEGACTFTVRYLDPEGNVLAEKSFKAE